VALQVLYQITEGANDPAEAMAAAWTRNSPESMDPECACGALGEGDCAFVRQLVETTLQRREELDAHLARLARDWSLERMGSVERAILRLAFTELLLGEVPASIVANEAVELAKRYGDDDSRRFINGIIGSAIRESGE
jgi:N utilization substance protein B